MLLWLTDLWIKGGPIPVEQLFHTLANIRGDVPRLECGYVLPHATLRQKATEKNKDERGLGVSRWVIKQILNKVNFYP